MLRDWADRLSGLAPAPERASLHLADTFCAFLAGARTREGRALAGIGRGLGAADRVAAVAAIARLTELDDIDLVSCVTPGAAVMPTVLALRDASGSRDWPRAVAVGYAAGMQLGEALGGAQSLAAGIWPSGVVAPVMGAAAAAIMLGADEEGLAHAMGLALASVTARIGRPAGSPSGRWYLFGAAVAQGLRAAEAASAGVRADLDLLSLDWLRLLVGREVPGFNAGAAPPSLLRVGFKPFATARQGANALWCLHVLMQAGLDPSAITRIEIAVPPMNAALLQRPAQPGDRLGTLSNAGLQAAIAVLAPDLLFDADRGALPLDRLRPFAEKVSVTADQDLSVHLPARWASRLKVTVGDEIVERELVAAPFDGDALDIAGFLARKWRKLSAACDDVRAVEQLAGARELPDLTSLIDARLGRPS
jgi:2-methylcitrate dehydratase PrpD